MDLNLKSLVANRQVLPETAFASVDEPSFGAGFSVAACFTRSASSAVAAGSAAIAASEVTAAARLPTSVPKP
jgi:hypothetical protein